MAGSSNGLASADVRRHNLTIMLRHLASSGPSSRSDLAETTGLKRGSITPLVQILQDAGLVGETTSVLGARGRPRTNLALTGEHHGLLVLQISPDRITGVVATLGAAEIARKSAAHHAQYGDQETVLDVGAEVLRTLFDAARRASCQVVDVTVIAQAPVGGEPAHVLGDAHMGWEPVDVIGELSRRVRRLAGIRTHLSSDAPLAALAELRRIGSPADAVYIKGDGMTIGGALIVDGEVVSGAHGFGGSLGHLAVVPDGLACSCGQRGCLVTVAGEPRTEAEWVQALDGIARALQILSMAIDPAVIVVGGGWAGRVDAIAEAFERNRPFVSRSGGMAVQVIAGRLGADAALIGGIEGAQQRVFGEPESFFS